MSEIDQSALDTVRALQRPGAPDLLCRIISVFVSQTPAAAKTISDACVNGDLEAVRVSAHTIKSSAAYLGAMQLSSRMADLERAAREEHLPICQKLSVDIEDHCQLVVDELLIIRDQAARDQAA